VPKLAVIAVGGFMALGALAANAKLFLSRNSRLLQIFALAFLVDLILVLLISGTNTAQEFFGTNGRATGFVAYTSLCGLLVSAAGVATQSTLTRISRILLGAGGLSVAYGLVQAFDLDPIKWANQYSPVIGFLGNPNFESSFVALTAVMAFAMALGTGLKIAIRAGLGIYVLVSLYVVGKTQSQQGFLVFAGGAAIIGFIWITKSKIKMLKVPSIALGVVGFVLVTLGSLNSGPLAGLLYKDSVTYRGDYWRAGWNMATGHPFFGVGLDSFGDWYRRARTVEATLRRGPDITSNAAHNVLVDFASNGGFPLLVIYLLLMALVLVSAFKLVKKMNGFDPIVVGLIAVWASYQAQAIISLNQLGLAVWGWIISGLIIGYEINSQDTQAEDKQSFKKGRSASAIAATKVAPRTLMGMFIGLLVGLLVGLPPLIASTKYKSALESGSAQIVERSAYIWPLEPIRMGMVAGLLQQNKLEANGLKVISDALEKFPDEYGLWSILAGMPGATAEQKAQAQTQMKRLDPHNPNLK
jgi:O-antigen ligase